jgi:hypothetical protein
MTPSRPVRIGNASAFYGDRLTSMRALVDGGQLDVITGDYLAELTMLILWKAKQKDPSLGYARTFLTQFQQVANDCAERGIKIVVNAGGLNPAGLAERVRALAADAGAELSSPMSKATISCLGSRHSEQQGCRSPTSTPG